MDWKLANEERASLMRIVALVLSLADLAQLASSRPKLVCALVYWILQRVEAPVTAFVMTGNVSAPAARSSDIRLDATRLALRLRALARTLKFQADLNFAHRDQAGTSFATTLLHRAADAVCPPAFRSAPAIRPHAVETPDTS